MVGGLQVGNKRSEETGDVCVMVMNAGGEGRQREKRHQRYGNAPRCGGGGVVEELAGASGMRWFGLKKKGRLLGTNMRGGGRGRLIFMLSNCHR